MALAEGTHLGQYEIMQPVAEGSGSDNAVPRFDPVHVEYPALWGALIRTRRCEAREST